MSKNFQDYAFSVANFFAEVSPWFHKKLNRFAINKIVNQCRTRPHPLSTMHNYVSWASLTDKSWSARHLPERDLNPPVIDDVISLFKRTEQKYCVKSTCLFPAFAQYLTDGFIRTKMPGKNEPDDPTRKQNTSNHEIDLCTLYGRNAAQTRALRLMDNTSGKRGRLKSQFINGEEYAPFLVSNGEINSDFFVLDPPLLSAATLKNPKLVERIFAFGGDRVNATPQAALLNTLFLRLHNDLAKDISASNTGWDDEQVFQVTRNTTIAIFIKVMIEEYINHISPSVKFIADPSVAWDAPWNKPNWITTEFSLLYRWHSLLPNYATWGSKRLSIAETIANNSPLIDGGLVNGLLDLSRQAATRMGPFNTAPELVALEKRAIDQGRLCKLASYSEYRQYCSLPAPQSFNDISKDPAVQDVLRRCYKDVGDVEFYVGLFAEDLDSSSPHPPLLRTLVAVDAFSQALTNPLLSKHVWKEETFSPAGWAAIKETKSIADIANRVCGGPIKGYIGMTRQDWKKP